MYLAITSASNYSTVGRLTAGYREVLEAAGVGIKLFQSLWNFTCAFWNSAVEVSVEFQSDTIITISNRMASRLHEIY